MNTFTLPDLGEGLTEAEIVRWLVAEGDEVAVDQAVVEVETAKSVVELPSPYAGKVATLHGAEGETVDVGKPLFSVEPSGSGNVLVGYGTTDTGSRRRRAPKAVVAAPVTRVISPLVRRLARDNGVDVTAIRATGPDGVVTRSDVMRVLDKPAPAAGKRIPLTGFRKAVSASLSRSRAEIPEATVWVDVDATELWNLRQSVQPGPGIIAYLARFVVAALQKYPVLNSSVEGDEIVLHDEINLGLAVQTDRGLVVPAVAGAQAMSLTTLDEAIRTVTAAAREGRVPSQPGTFTLNNYGSFNVDGSAAIINHPQVAILGFGRIIDRPWVVGGEIVPRKITQMSFVFDHRVCDGGTAAGFMRAVADAIEAPIPAIVRL